jgi:hypothetical protein
MTRRAASVTQADAARFMRAAKQIGAYAVELHAGVLKAVLIYVDKGQIEVAAPPPDPPKEEFDPI